MKYCGNGVKRTSQNDEERICRWHFQKREQLNKMSEQMW